MARKKVHRVDGRTVEMPDADEMLHRRVYIRNLFASGLPTAEIIDIAKQSREIDGRIIQGIEEKKVRYLIREIREELRIELDLTTAQENKAVALNRLYRDLASARADLSTMRSTLRDPLTGVPLPASNKGWTAVSTQQGTVLRLERLIAELEGTLDPVKIQVGVQGVNEALQRALTSMTPAQIEQAIEENRQELRDQQAIMTHGVENPGSQAKGGPAPTEAGNTNQIAASSNHEQESPSVGRGQRPALQAPSQRNLASRAPEAPPGRQRQQPPAEHRPSVRPGATVDQGPGTRGVSARVITG